MTMCFYGLDMKQRLSSSHVDCLLTECVACAHFLSSVTIVLTSLFALFYPNLLLSLTMLSDCIVFASELLFEIVGVIHKIYGVDPKLLNICMYFTASLTLRIQLLDSNIQMTGETMICPETIMHKRKTLGRQVERLMKQLILKHHLGLDLKRITRTRIYAHRKT
ncbi:hypothetical protein ACJX0J_028340, partial [Zea mays]